MPENDIMVRMVRKNKEQELLRVAHGKKDPWAFSMKVGIDSPRNLEIYLRKCGIYDGHEWTHGEIAAEYGISRPRSVQICKRTQALLSRHYKELAVQQAKEDSNKTEGVDSRV